MRRSALALAVLVVAGAFVLPVSATAPAATGTPAAVDVAGDFFSTNETETRGDEESVAPGERLAGIIGVQGAEVRGEVESRSFAVEVDRAEGNNSKAAVVAAQYDTNAERLAQLRERQQELTRAYENGSLSRGQYAAQMAQLTAQIRTVQRLTNQTEATAQQLPAESLNAKGVDVGKIRTLKQEAGSMTGPEVSALARGIAGPNVGNAVGPAANNSTAPGRSGSAQGNSQVGAKAGSANAGAGVNANANASTKGGGNANPGGASNANLSSGVNSSAVNGTENVSSLNDGVDVEETTTAENETGSSALVELPGLSMAAPAATVTALARTPS